MPGTSHEEATRWARRIERALWAIGAGCLAWYGLVAAEALFYQRAERAALAQMMTRIRQPPGFDRGLSARPPALSAGSAVGILAIPRLHLSVAVVNGDDTGTLRVAVGHLPDTPLPWEDGNSALAGHRDTFFRPLETIRVNDEVRVVNARPRMPTSAGIARSRKASLPRPRQATVRSCLAPASYSRVQLDAAPNTSTTASRTPLHTLSTSRCDVSVRAALTSASCTRSGRRLTGVEVGRSEATLTVTARQVYRNGRATT